MRWVLAVALAAALAIGAWAFEPWRLFTSSELTEAAPSSSPSSSPDSPSSAAESSAGGGSESPSPEPPPGDQVLATGRFEDAEHATSGSVRVLELVDGTRFVRLEGLATSDGPDLHVWLSDRPSGGDWGSYDDGRWVALGELKATHGDHNYEIPASARIAGMRSVVIWCDRFDVAFGSAPVELA
jgi:hypothetical protein